MSMLEVLDLTEDERTKPPKALGRLKTLTEWMSSAVDSGKDNKEFTKTLSDLSPWADAAFEAARDTIPPLKFVVKLFSEITKVQDPAALARLAATLAYQSAAEQAFRKLEGPAGRPPNELPGLPESEDADFGSLNLQNAVAHEFVRKADSVLAYHAERAGYTKEQVNRVVRQVHAAFSEELAILLSHGDTKEKFDPLLRWLNVKEGWASERAALRRHAEYLDWLFQKSPVFQHEPFALAHIYVEPECSKLTRG